METNKYKVLLIEDDRIAQTAFKRLVSEENLPYDYTIAGSASEATTIIEENKFDIVIVDYLLGDGTAFDLFDSIKDTPIIFATGAGNEELAVKAMKKGAYDYLIKNTTRNYLKVLPEIVENAINHKKIENELKDYHSNLEKRVKERTEQLAKEKELLSVTLSSMGEGVIVVDIEKRIMLFNSVAEDITGWKFEEVENKPVDEVLHVLDERTKDEIDNPFDLVMESGDINSTNECDSLISKDGGEHPIFATTAPIKNNDGGLMGIVVVFRDVSREREIDRMKTDFVSSVSHELRTPLTSIKAYTATILRDPNMPEQTQRQFLTVINGESNRLQSLVEDLMKISRIESGTMNIVTQSLDVAIVLDKVITALKPTVSEKNIKLETNIDDGLGHLQADESKIESVITNLISNAIKFTPEEGRITISAKQIQEEIVISVNDSGMGIPKEDLPKIFNRFYRVNRPGTQIQGTGLGLAIVNEIVKAHGGRIDVVSELNQGTTFTVVLPMETSPALEPAGIG